MHAELGIDHLTSKGVEGLWFFRNKYSNPLLMKKILWSSRWQLLLLFWIQIFPVTYRVTFWERKQKWLIASTKQDQYERRENSFKFTEYIECIYIMWQDIISILPGTEFINKYISFNLMFCFHVQNYESNPDVNL